MLDTQKIGADRQHSIKEIDSHLHISTHRLILIGFEIG